MMSSYENHAKRVLCAVSAFFYQSLHVLNIKPCQNTTELRANTLHVQHKAY